MFGYVYNPGKSICSFIETTTLLQMIFKIYIKQAVLRTAGLEISNDLISPD